MDRPKTDANVQAKEGQRCQTSISSRAACTFEASLSYAQEVMKLGPTLRTFYCFKRVKRIKHDSAKARRGDLTLLRTHFSRWSTATFLPKNLLIGAQSLLLDWPIFLPTLVHHHYTQVSVAILHRKRVNSYDVI
jgi:hypothetical protein